MERETKPGMPDVRGARPSTASGGAACITCPKCRRTSYNPNDISSGYCGFCHDFTGMQPVKAQIPEPPKFMRDLSVDPKRSYLVPWFVKWINGQPEFRVMDRDKFVKAIREKRCWICGNLLYSEQVFVIGPMCAINRISSEPPSHRECARYSARVCPFLSKPQMTRRPMEDIDKSKHAAGIMIERNPGVTLLYYTKRFRILEVDNGVLFQLGRAFKVEWFREGREATRAEVMESMKTGLPALENACDLDLDPAAAREELKVQIKKALVLVPR